MDAVTLAVPTTAPVNAAVLPTDKSGLPPGTDGEGAALDFATLLAGLGLQQPGAPEAAPPASEVATEKKPGDSEDKVDAAALIADPNQALATPPALPAPPAVVEHIARSVEHANAQAEGKAAAAKLAAGAPRADAARTTDAAAEAASLAARAEEKPTSRAVSQFQMELAAETRALDEAADSLRTTTAAEAAAHALNLQSIEQRPAVQQQPTAVLDVSAPVGSKGFADALSQQVVWMVDKDAQVAELRINPPELGPVEVRLTVNGDQASAQFVSTHSEVREAIETSIARLRESFAEAGIQLGQASVSAESFREQAQQGQGDARSSAPTGYGTTARTAETTSAPAAAIHVRRGLVDTFA